MVYIVFCERRIGLQSYLFTSAHCCGEGAIAFWRMMVERSGKDAAAFIRANCLINLCTYAHVRKRNKSVSVQTHLAVGHYLCAGKMACQPSSHGCEPEKYKDFS